MPNLLDIIRNTPLWVFVLLAVLIAIGVQALRPRTVALWRLLIVPAVFIAWGVLSLVTKLAGLPVLAIDWLLAGVAGAAVAWWTTRLDAVHIDRQARRVQMPGSAVPLVRNLVIFAAKYGLAVAMAMAIAPALQSSLVLWDIGVSGLSAGYFAGWLFRFALRYRAATPAQPAAGAV